MSPLGVTGRFGCIRRDAASFRATRTGYAITTMRQDNGRDAQMPDDHAPLPEKLFDQIRVMRHDLVQVRENLALGRVRPEHYANVGRALDARLELLEAEVHARLLDEARRRNARFRLN